MQKNLDLTIQIKDDSWFEIYVYEPESGEQAHFEFPLSFDEHPEFDEAIGMEIYSWLSLWADECNEE